MDRGYCKDCKRRTRNQNGMGLWCCVYCSMNKEENRSPDEDKILNLARSSKLTIEELTNLIKHKSTKVETRAGQPYTVTGKKFSIGVMGDTHIGSKFYDAKLMKEAARVFNERKVDFVIHVGDITEGHYESKRQGSVFELTEIGGDEQVDRAVKELSQIKRPIYAITGNHEHNTFFKLCGFDVGKQLATRLPNFHYLGNMHGTIKLPHGKKIEILHPGGGSSYALSYRPQKIVESLEGGSKPDILLIGHFHKALYMYYRNVHALMTGTLQSQTSFMREHGLAAHKGFYILNFEVTKNGIKHISPEYHPAY